MNEPPKMPRWLFWSLLIGGPIVLIVLYIGYSLLLKSFDVFLGPHG